MNKVATTLSEQLRPLVNRMGFDLIGCELDQSVLRVYIDKESGITLEDCSKVSRQIGAMLEVEHKARGHYVLEISSPGLDRPLFELAHYQKQIGSQVKIRVYVPINNRRKFTGILIRVEESNIHLLVDTEEVVLPFSEIEKGNVVADIR